MKDKPLNAIAEIVHGLAKDKGWHDDWNGNVGHNEDAFFERACNNLHDEVSELHEAWRNNKLRSDCDKADQMRANNLPVLSCLEEELADIIIRVCDNAVRLGVDLDKAVTAKHLFNQTRPDRHGGKRS